MSFSVVNGYDKRTWDDLLLVLTNAINAQFSTDFTTDTIIGSNHFKFFYGGLQLVMETENKIGELGVKIADYIRTTNESISQPISSADGTVDYFKDTLGFDVSLKSIESIADAGKPVLCVDVDPARTDFASVKQQIFDAIHHSQTEGLFWYDSSSLPASNEYRGFASGLNGQSFKYCFFTPTIVTTKVKITVTRSRSSLAYQLNATEIAELFETNFASMYKLGNDFEGEKYLNTASIDSASNVKVESSINGGSTWQEGVRQMTYNQKIVLDTIEVVEG